MQYSLVVWWDGWSRLCYQSSWLIRYNTPEWQHSLSYLMQYAAELMTLYNHEWHKMFLKTILHILSNANWKDTVFTLQRGCLKRHDYGNRKIASWTSDERCRSVIPNLIPVAFLLTWINFYPRLDIIFVWRKHETMSPWTGSRVITVKPVCNDPLYNKIYYRGFIQQCVLMKIEGTN